MAKTMVFRSVDGTDYRVSVERTSVNARAAFVKFTRSDRYRPMWVGHDGTAWVQADKLHFVAEKATAAPTKGSGKTVKEATAKLAPQFKSF